MTLKRMLPLVTVLSIFAALLSAQPYAADDEKFDIAGLRLGMTYEQVKEALVGHGILESDMQETRQSYHYSDGLKNDYRTDDFLFRIVANKSIHGNQSEEFFGIYFSPPPDGGEVVAVTRIVKNEIDPPTNKQYRDAVHAKYGLPTVPHKNVNISQWMFGGGTINCLGSQYEELSLPVNSRGNNVVLERVFHTSGSMILTDRFRNGRVKSLQECANILQYDIHGYGLGDDRPATSVGVLLIDVQTWVQAELAAGAMVESLRQEAIKKREDSGTNPIL